METDHAILPFPPVSDTEEAEPQDVVPPGQQAPQSNPPPEFTSNKVCSRWYHYGSCSRDPANPTEAGKPCHLLHELPVGGQSVVLSFTSYWMHKQACGLELCEWKDDALEMVRKKK